MPVCFWAQFKRLVLVFKALQLWTRVAEGTPSPIQPTAFSNTAFSNTGPLCEIVRGTILHFPPSTEVRGQKQGHSPMWPPSHGTPLHSTNCLLPWSHQEGTKTFKISVGTYTVLAGGTDFPFLLCLFFNVLCVPLLPSFKALLFIIIYCCSFFCTAVLLYAPIFYNIIYCRCFYDCLCCCL